MRLPTALTIRHHNWESSQGSSKGYELPQFLKDFGNESRRNRYSCSNRNDGLQFSPRSTPHRRQIPYAWYVWNDSPERPTDKHPCEIERNLTVSGEQKS